MSTLTDFMFKRDAVKLEQAVWTLYIHIYCTSKFTALHERLTDGLGLPRVMYF